MGMSEHGLELPPAPASVGEARRFVGAQLVDLGATSVSEVAALLTSELVTNAIVHAGGRIRVRVIDREGTIRVSVEDPSSAQPRRRRATERAVTGRGLALIDDLAAHWGVDSLPGHQGKAVWFELHP